MTPDPGNEWRECFLFDRWPPLSKDDLDLFRAEIAPRHPDVREDSGLARTLVASFRAGQRIARMQRQIMLAAVAGTPTAEDAP